MTYTEKELDQFLHGISLSLLSKKSAQHWRYDEETAKEIEWLEALERKVRADKADRKGKWIPCSERLPLHGSRVLVTATHKKLGHTAVDVLRYHGDEYGWEGSDFCIVNAWMPLPAIWEEGESNG